MSDHFLGVMIKIWGYILPMAASCVCYLCKKANLRIALIPRTLTQHCQLAEERIAKMIPHTPSESPPSNLAALAEDHYFSANPPPKDLQKHMKLAKDFIEFHSKAGRRLVLVTSGGTTVPLGMLTPGQVRIGER